MHCRAGDITHPGTGKQEGRGQECANPALPSLGRAGLAWGRAGSYPPMTGQLVLHGPAGVGGHSLAVAVAGESYCSARGMSRSGS